MLSAICLQPLRNEKCSAQTEIYTKRVLKFLENKIQKSVKKALDARDRRVDAVLILYFIALWRPSNHRERGRRRIQLRRQYL